MNKLTPSVFLDHPWESSLQNTECEIVASNIMKIRKRLGNKWPLTLKQYKKEREKDGHYSWMEEDCFEKVIELIPDAVGAISFSKVWADAARKASK